MQYTQFNLTRDINGYNGFGLPFSINKYNAILAQNTDTTVTVPSFSAHYIAVFSFQDGASVWVANNATAAVPVGGTFAATTSELNPVARYVKAADVLHFFTSDTSAQVGVVFYALPNA
jgi:hypothetical protein